MADLISDTIRNRLSLFRFTAVHRSCPVPNRPCLTDLPNPNYQLIPINILSYNLSFPNLKPVLLFILICYIQSYIIYSILSYLLSCIVYPGLSFQPNIPPYPVLTHLPLSYPMLYYIISFPSNPVAYSCLYCLVFFANYSPCQSYII